MEKFFVVIMMATNSDLPILQKGTDTFQTRESCEETVLEFLKTTSQNFTTKYEKTFDSTYFIFQPEAGKEPVRMECLEITTNKQQ